MTTKTRIIWGLIGLAALPYLFIWIPQFLGFEPYVVTSGSMEPAIAQGSVIYNTEVPSSEIRNGDVITFRPNNTEDLGPRVTHRVVDTREGNFTRYFKTQGDNNVYPDPGWTPAYNVYGKEVFTLPFLGHIMRVTHNPVFAVFMIILPAVFLARKELGKIMEEMEEQV